VVALSVVCYFVLCVLLYFIVLYCTVLYCPVLHCSAPPPGINPFAVTTTSTTTNNNNILRFLTKASSVRLLSAVVKVVKQPVSSGY
jgi:hypothetical protein